MSDERKAMSAEERALRIMHPDFQECRKVNCIEAQARIAKEICSAESEARNKALEEAAKREAELKAQADALAEALENAKSMSNELLRTMDDGHWYHDDLVSLRVRIINALAAYRAKEKA